MVEEDKREPEEEGSDGKATVVVDKVETPMKKKVSSVATKKCNVLVLQDYNVVGKTLETLKKKKHTLDQKHANQSLLIFLDYTKP